MSEQADYFQPLTDEKLLHGRAALGAAYTTIAQIARALISILSQIVLSRLLAPAQFGIIAMVAPVLAFIQLFNSFGVAGAVIQNDRLTQSDVSALYWLGLGASTLCAIICMLVSPLAAWAYHRPEVGPVLVVLAIQLPIGALAGHASALMTRRLRFGAIALIEVVAAVAGLASSVAFALMGLSYWALVLGQLVQTCIQASGEWLLAGWRPSGFRWSANVRQMLHFGANMTGFNLLSIFSLYCDNVLVGILNGPKALGLFDRGFSLVLRPLGSITAPIGRVATPLLSRLNSEPASYRATFISMLQGLVLLGAPGLIAGSVMTDDFIGVVLGKQWLPASPIVSAICAAAIFTSLSGASYWIFTSQNRPHEQLRCGMISSFLILVALLAGVRWGPRGIAISYALFAPLVHGCFIWIAGASGPVRRRDVFNGLYPLAVALGAACAVTLLIRATLNAPPVALCGVSIVTSYLATGSVFLLFPQGRRLVASSGSLLRLRRAV